MQTQYYLVILRDVTSRRLLSYKAYKGVINIELKSVAAKATMVPMPLITRMTHVTIEFSKLEIPLVH